MWSILKVRLGIKLFQFGANILIQRIFGRNVNRHLESVVKKLSLDDTLTGKQKYNRAKKFLDEVNEDAPDTLKNLAIEIMVSKVRKMV